MQFLANNGDLIIFGLLIILGYVAGSLAEKRHYASIKKREREMVSMPVVTFADGYPASMAIDSYLVTGSAVISIDYFKSKVKRILLSAVREVLECNREKTKFTWTFNYQQIF